MEKNEITRAYVIGRNGDVIGIIDTHIKSGLIKYGFAKTIDGTPVNLRYGKLSRAKKYAKKAWEAGYSTDLYIVEC